MDHRLIMAFFSQLSVEFKIMIFFYLDRFIRCIRSQATLFMV